MPQAAGATFLALPDALHGVIRSYLLTTGYKNRDLGGTTMRVAETCKGLVGPYGGCIDGLHLERPQEVEWRIDALVGLVRRQEALTRLRVADQSLLPFVSEALVAGAAQHLDELQIKAIELERATALSLVRMLQANRLPALSVLVLDGSWRNARSDSLSNCWRMGRRLGSRYWSLRLPGRSGEGNS